MENLFPKISKFWGNFFVIIFLFLFSNSFVNAQFSASFTDPTPLDGSTITSDPTIKVSSIDPGQHYVLNNIDNSLVGWWRGENNGNDESSLSNTGVPISTDSSYTKVNTSSGTATADDTYPPWSSYAGPTQAFDGDTGSYWYCGSDLRPGFTHWLKIDLGAGNEKIVTKTRMYYSSPSTALGGKIQGSNDDSTWTDLSSFSHGAINTWYTDTFSNSTSYRYYRIFLNSGDPSNWWPKINEVELYTGGAYVSGKFGKAFNFGGTANYISIPSSSVYTMDTTNKLTVSAWVYSNTNSNGAAYTRILGHADTDGSYDLYWDHAWGGATFSIMTEDHQYHWATSPTQLNSGQWYHLVGTYDGENVKLYVGATLVATTPTTGSIHAIESPITIGASNLAGSFFSGKIDDVTLWNRALSLSEIKSLYNASTYQYNQTFTLLALTSHTIQAYAISTDGSNYSTGLRTFTLGVGTTSPSSNNNIIINLNSTPSCSDSKPSSSPDLFQINTSKNSAKLFFSPISNTQKFHISYSTKPNAQDYGAEVTLAKEGVQNFTINSLKPNTTYYIKVRGQNGCMPGDWSNIIKIKTNSQKYYKYSKNNYSKISSPKKVSNVRPVQNSPVDTLLVAPTNVPQQTSPSPVTTSTPAKKCFLWWCR